MTYEKPQAIALGPAANAIQSSGVKLKGLYESMELNFPLRYTISAYEADE